MQTMATWDVPDARQLKKLQGWTPLQPSQRVVAVVLRNTDAVSAVSVVRGGLLSIRSRTSRQRHNIRNAS
jgi:hypothetical protein